MSLFEGFDYEPMQGFVVTPEGQDHFTLKMQTPPIRSLGEEVQVEFEVKPNWYYNGTNCVKFPSITFNSNNWQEPKRIDMTFNDYGCCTYAIVGKGGGYEWQYTLRSLTVYACDGEAGYGCKGKSPCGA